MKDLVWLEIPEFTGYEISSTGQVRSYRPINGRGGLTSIPRILKPSRDKDGYFRVVLMLNGRRYYRTIHKLVARAFLGLPMDKEVRHLDGDNTNNNITNLMYGTAKENSIDRTRHNRGIEFEKNPRSVLTAKDVKNIRKHLLIDSTPKAKKHLASIYGVSRSTIQDILVERSWKGLM